ncbi:hypothetical protein BJF89_13825 [Corynebacterium sp. CNJ-954]|uniref:hypothetical protein n=1 Tax=Corynebacterium sp. CNJ-954 TaxID=1904962 RepID=UPI000961A42D|nr:hypothetical protein [Corynebacterium sp. CNJ-954]OLT55861.1 hypothetical protein BJF89_13825 [Corynebacterium sp. CNJ-954]
MTRIKITDLEQFALDDLWRPYLPLHPGYNPKEYQQFRDAYIGGIAGTYDPDFLEATLLMLRKNPILAGHAIDRAQRVGYRIPFYVQHPLVDFLIEHKAVARR